jgi:hypothetical protein
MVSPMYRLSLISEESRCANTFAGSGVIDPIDK